MHVILVLIAALGTSSAAAENVKVSAGTNDIGVLEGESRLVLTLARRENFNAHSFDVAMFSAKVPSSAGVLISHVPLFDGETEAPVLETREGADCVLKDFRLVSELQNYRLIVGERDFGSNFADSQIVRYTIYELTRNLEEEIGRPLHYFERVGTRVSSQKHCDVEEAFQDDWKLSENREIVAPPAN